MYKESMDGQTILFISDSFCKAYHLKYFNERYYDVINSQLTNVKEIYYKCNNSRNSWINYKQAMQSQAGTTFIDKVLNAYKDVLTNNIRLYKELPECEYIDAYGFKHNVGAKDGIDSPSAVKSRLLLKPENFEFTPGFEMIDGERKHTLKVNFKADISDAIIIFNGCFYPYEKQKDGTSVIYREKDGVEFPKKFDKYGRPVLNKDGSIKIFDPNKEREYYSIIPYTWSHVNKVWYEKEDGSRIDYFGAISMDGEWFEMEQEVDSGCLLFYNSVMYFYEINKHNDKFIKILDIDRGNSTNFDLSKVRMVRFVNENDKTPLKQQKMVGLFQKDKKNTTVYFPSSVSDGILTYNGINETYLINPDKKSIRFMMPHEVYGVNQDLLTSIDSLSKIYCINFYTGDLDSNTFTMPHDELTNIANTLINEYKAEADRAKMKLSKLEKERQLVYPNYKDTISQYRTAEFSKEIIKGMVAGAVKG